MIMKTLSYRHHLLSLLILFLVSSTLRAQQAAPAKSASVEERVEALLDQMTLAEKVGQMTQINITLINNTGEQKDVTLNEQKLRDIVSTHHVGSFLNGEAVPGSQWYEYSRKLQKVAMEASRLNIPIVYGIDHIHGASYVANSTIFPQAINIGSTFNNDFAYNAGKVTVMESADLGHHWVFAPVLDVGLNPYWPRYWETYGEDPLLAARMGAAFTKGIQDPHPEIAPYRIAATGKHFLGYSTPQSGWDRTPAYISSQRLHEIHRKPFQTAIDSGIHSLMINSGEINGVPVHASKEILTDLLRTEMGFEGVVVTDWADIEKLFNYHRVAHDMKEATRMAVEAGIDMSMTPLNFSFNESLIELVEEGTITEERIDESVRRILTMKFELGLFDNPMPRNDRLERIGGEAHRELALNAARESMVLLKNKDGLLPLNTKKTKRMVLAGPTINSKRNLSGGWTLAWQGGSDDGMYPESMMTVYDAMKKAFPKTRIDTISAIRSDKDRERFQKMLRKADATVIVAGEQPYTEFIGNITSLKLPQDQLDLIAEAGKGDAPVALVLVEGRPRVFTDVIDATDAILFAGLPGFEGAQAISEVLNGSVNPSGKISFSYPAYVGHFATYRRKPSSAYFFDPSEANFIQQSENKSTSLFEFGHGLSYTSYTYSDLALSDSVLTSGGTIEAKVTVTNTGDRDGKESVLWFTTDEVGTITRPVRELEHYEKRAVEAGSSETFTFTITPELLSYPDQDGTPILEDGFFTLQVGDQKARFQLKQLDSTSASR